MTLNFGRKTATRAALAALLLGMSAPAVQAEDKFIIVQ